MLSKLNITPIFLALLYMAMSQVLSSSEQGKTDNQPVEKPYILENKVDEQLPTVWLIGDSTVKVSTAGQTGWGEVISDYFDLTKTNVVNRAIGGRSSRSFVSDGRWDDIMKLLQPGDFVIIQFGHNDSGNINDNHRARGTIKGIGEETEEIDNMITGKHEIVHSYGWYIRKYSKDTLDKGATPIICSLVPRKMWDEDMVKRGKNSYEDWAREVAEDEGVAFVNLHEIIARGYEKVGVEKVEDFFADHHTHTTKEGAIFNAEAVISGLKGNPELEILQYLSKSAKSITPYAPKDWIDPDTGHHVIRLSEKPGTASLYFHQNAYTAKGDKLVVTTSEGIGTINLITRKNVLIVANPKARVLVVGKKSRSVYYTLTEKNKTTVYATHIDTKSTRKIVELPKGAGVVSLNADETLLLGSITKTPRKPLAGKGNSVSKSKSAQGRWMVEKDMKHPVTGELLTYAEQKEWFLNNRLEARIPITIFVINTKTGEKTDVHSATDWLNHLQFSPTDPERILFCHEGPWHKVDRIWTIKTDGSDLRRLHARTMNMEIAGHEFFSPDGKNIYYDLQRPRGEVFWLASVSLESGKRNWYALDRNYWSVHFNVSPDQTLFAGDGGDDEMVAHAPDGKWIYLFHPRAIPDVAGISAPGAEDLISPGVLDAERLVNMKYHDYRLEPNVTFTPDGKWIIFRSNMHGPVHTYAVEL